MFCFWMNFITARNFKIFFTFLSYDQSVLVLWKKVTILAKLSSLIILKRKGEVLKSRHCFQGMANWLFLVQKFSIKETLVCEKWINQHDTSVEQKNKLVCLKLWNAIFWPGNLDGNNVTTHCSLRMYHLEVSSYFFEKISKPELRHKNN